MAAATAWFSVLLLVAINTNIKALEWKHWPGKCLDSAASVIAWADHLHECMARCEIEQNFLCASINYQVDLKLCELHVASSMNTRQRNCPTWDLYDIRDLSVWTSATDGCLNADVMRVVNGQGSNMCQHICATETDFRCDSFTYNYDEQKCSFHRENSVNRHLSEPCEFPNNEFYEREKWPIVRMNNDTRYTGPHFKTIANITVRQCVEACVFESSQPCKSVNYWKVNAECQLNNASTPTALVNNTVSLYSITERTPWRFFSNTCIFENVIEVLIDLTPNGCMEACETYPGGDCKSVEYRDGECTLLSVWSGTARMSVPCQRGNFDHYEIAPKCP